MEIVALAGGIGAGKFLRGVRRVAAAEGHRLSVIVNTGDDLDHLGVHVSPDLDSVCHWLSGEMDRERGWGVRGETFAMMEALRANPLAPGWFNLGDRDLSTHLYRTMRLRQGATLSAVTAELARERFGIEATILPMTDDPVTTRIVVRGVDGVSEDLHFQEYWVDRKAQGHVVEVRFDGASTARPAAGVEPALTAADAILLCPSNPVVSLGPILAIPGVRSLLRRRRDVTVGVSPIVGGAPLAGMADRLMPAVGLEVSAIGAARSVADVATGWVVDTTDRDLADAIEDELPGMRVRVTDTVMRDDDVATEVARTALSVVSG
jgi:LPPG:FO 2-phospho-L-lactate transferase